MNISGLNLQKKLKLLYVFKYSFINKNANTII